LYGVTCEGHLSYALFQKDLETVELMVASPALAGGGLGLQPPP
jgi:hypothetical protein